MKIFWLLICLHASLPLFLQPASGSTAIQVTVLDRASTGQQIILTITMGHQSLEIETDTHGTAMIAIDDPSIPDVLIVMATVDGRTIQLDQNIPSGAIRIVPVPGHTRPVVLFFDGEMLHLTPESLFAGVDSTGKPNDVPLTINGSLPSTSDNDTATVDVDSENPTETDVIVAPALPSQTPMPFEEDEASDRYEETPSAGPWFCVLLLMLLVATAFFSIIRKERQKNEVRLRAWKEGEHDHA